MGIKKRLKLSPVLQVRKISLKAGVGEASPSAQKWEFGYVGMGKKDILWEYFNAEWMRSMD